MHCDSSYVGLFQAAGTRKDRGKVTAYRNSPTLFRTVPSPTPYDLLFLKIVLCNPVNFWALNANSSKTAEDTNFKFGRRVPRVGPHMTLKNISEKWAWSRSRDPVNFGALNVNSSKTAEDTNFKFGRHVPGNSPHMTPDKYFRKVGVVTVT